MEVFDITNKSSQSLGTSLNRGSTAIALFTKVTRKRRAGKEILGFGIRNSTQGTRNPAYDCNLKSKFYVWRAVCFKIDFFIGYKFLISFADRIYRPVIDQLKYCYIVLIFYQIHVKSISQHIINRSDRSVVRDQP